MQFEPTPIDGAFVIRPDRFEDDRGFFARTYAEEPFAARGLNTHWPQCNISFNRRRGTLRGLHWQEDPHGEVKLVRCVRGALHDVAVDLRPDSPTYLKTAAVELDADSAVAFYIPVGCAHGFQTLSDDTEVFYQMGAVYRPEAARGLRYDDPAFAIPWPVPDPILSDKDRALPMLSATGPVLV